MFSQTRRSLAAWTLLILVLIQLILGTAVYLAVSRLLISNVDQALRLEAEQVEESVSATVQGNGEPSDPPYVGTLFYVVEDGADRVLAQSPEVDASQVTSLVHPTQQAYFVTANIQGSPARVIVRPLADPQDPPSDTLLVVGRSLAEQDQTLRALLAGLVAVGGFGALLAVGGAWFLAGRALVPIQTAWTRQQQFVADASHELRTPLAVVRASLDLLGRHRHEPLAANDDLFDDLRNEVARLERLAADLLLLAGLDQGALALAVAAVDLVAVAKQVVRRVEPFAAERGVQLHLDAPPPPALVEADPDRVQQILLILLDNAIKHTPAGGRVVLRLHLREALVQIGVQDSGAGIPPEHLAHIFDRFYRADVARSPDAGGSGLGLAIAYALVHAHGGQLSLTSRIGSGTCAEVALPRLRPPRSLPRPFSQRAPS